VFQKTLAFLTIPLPQLHTLNRVASLPAFHTGPDQAPFPYSLPWSHDYFPCSLGKKSKAVSVLN
jgi:hypothetical protein